MRLSSKLSIGAAWLLALATTALANPVMEAAKAIGTQGLATRKASAESPTQFKPTGSTKHLDAYLKQYFSDPNEFKQMQGATLAVRDAFEKEMEPRGMANDASAALAYAFCGLLDAAGKPNGDDAFLKLVPRLRAHFDTAAVRSATDDQKQELYERSMAALTFGMTLNQAAENDAAKQQVKLAAETLLQGLVGGDANTFSFKGMELVVSIPTANAQPNKPAPTGNGLESTGSVAPGFTVAPPQGWSLNGSWYEKYVERTERTKSRALIRFPAAIIPKGNMGDALRSLWETQIPAEGKGRHSAIVFRRYVGERLHAQFIQGKFKEKGQAIETCFMLMLIDCKTHWQPVVIALTYESNEPGSSFSATYSYPDTMQEAEEFLKGLRCAPAAGLPLVDRNALAGDYHYGSGANTWLQNVNTGATSMAFVSYGGTLNLKADGSFTYTFSSASNPGAGGTSFRGAKGSGTWAIGGDELICTFKEYDQGDGYKVKEQRYRIGGVTIFQDGTKLAVLMSKMNRPVNIITTGDSADWYTTKPPKKD